MSITAKRLREAECSLVMAISWSGGGGDKAELGIALAHYGDALIAHHKAVEAAQAIAKS